MSMRSFDLSGLLAQAEQIIEAEYREIESAQEATSYTIELNAGQLELLQDVLVEEVGAKIQLRHDAPEMVRDLIALAKAAKAARAS